MIRQPPELRAREPSLSGAHRGGPSGPPLAFHGSRDRSGSLKMTPLPAGAEMAAKRKTDPLVFCV
jgi:hypothetical protein